MRVSCRDKAAQKIDTMLFQHPLGDADSTDRQYKR